MEPALVELKRRLAEIADLRRAEYVLAWDMEVGMPRNGASARAVQLGTLSAVMHDRQIDDRIGELTDELAGYAASLAPDSDDACLVRVARRDWERKRRVPTELAAELTKTQAEAHNVWVRARENDDFASFRPWLERIVELKQRYVECFAPYDDPYDVLLDDYEEGLATAEVRAAFAALAPALTALVDEFAVEGEDAFLAGPFSVEMQDVLSRELAERFGVRWDSFRLDRAVHPFEITFGPGDVRLTTRYADDDLNSLFTAMHETGHGLYEWGSSPSLDRTPLWGGASMALHESQSRLWENVVGRSLPVWRWFFPRLQEAFPDPLGDVTLEQFHRAVNRVRRSYVRVDADETSYGLHVILRFELEQELVTGRLAVADLPEAWNTRFRELLGIEVPNDRLGALQDSHWAGGSIGYFPTYLLGSVLSVQIWERALEALPDLEGQIERGDFSALHDWLRDNLFVLGRKFTPKDTIERVVGRPLDPEPYLAYLRGKQTAVAST
jgi:carboxypeptidase Taq